MARRPWPGYGSALFLGLGTLTPRSERHPEKLRGEVVLRLYFHWRLENDRKAECGLSEHRRVIDRNIAGLQGSNCDH